MSHAEVWKETNADGSLYGYRVLCMQHDPDGAMTHDEIQALLRAASHDKLNHDGVPCPGRLLSGLTCALLDGHEGPHYNRFALRDPVEV